jgi:DNA polymerase-3 subunit epsilon
MSTKAGKSDLEAMAAQLDAHSDYQVLRRLDPARQHPGLSGGAISRAVIVDTETTGMDPKSDELIEIGLVAFEYSRETGEIGRVLETYNGLEDPGMPIPPESTAVHGITDQMVSGQRFDDDAVSRMLEGVAIVIAHNAGFDRPFVEPRFERFASLAWGCSWQEIPWEEAGISSAKLEYLAYRHGFFFEGHRAEIDCLALLEVLRRPFGDTGKTNLKVLLDSARKPSVRLWASNSPFESKELLKARAYRWEPERKTWYRDLPKDEAKTEVAWLKAEIFGGRSVALNMEVFNARTRYAGREGRQETVRA